MGAPRPYSTRSSLLDAYSIRIMLGLLASLSLLLALVHFPLRTPVNGVGWSARSPAESIVLSDMGPERSAEEDSDAEGSETAPPPTHQRAPRPDPSTRSVVSEDSGTESTLSDSGRASESDPGDVQSIATLGVNDQKPQIVGGMGTLYLNINYPEKARKEGIEGRLRLEFTVEADGEVTAVDVVDSLHPLCDSAAVEGVRSVHFVPAKRDGDPVPIRLKLPITFQLTTATSIIQPSGLRQ